VCEDDPRLACARVSAMCSTGRRYKSAKCKHGALSFSLAQRALKSTQVTLRTNKKTETENNKEKQKTKRKKKNNKEKQNRKQKTETENNTCL
jgi:hypothetical protein